MTGKEAIRKLRVAGWTVDRVKGSHHVLYKHGHPPVAVPVHGNRDLGIGLLRNLERVTGVKLRN